MKRVKHIYILGFILGFLLFNTNDVKASHIMGGDLTYTCSGTNTYNLQLRLFRDCLGINLPTTATVTFTSPSCATFQVTLDLLPNYPIDITPICPSMQSACNGGSGPLGVQEYVYKKAVTVPPCATPYTMSWSSCCRNGAINTLQGPGGTGFIITSDLNTATTPCNNSPDFLNSPVAYFCVNQPVNYNHGATDFDNDSLVFSLVPCQGSGINYQFPYSGTTPLASQNGVTIDPATGGLTFVPTQQQTAVLCVLVEEYRNGIKIGEIMRDMQFEIQNCPNILPVASGIDGTASSTGTTGNFTMTVCADDTVDFLVRTYDANVVDIFDPMSGWNTIVLDWNQAIQGAQFVSDAASPYPTGHFTWVPDNSDVGNNIFTVDVRDDACMITGINIYSFLIIVEERPEMDAGNYQVTCSPGDSVTLNGTFNSATNQSGSFVWSPPQFLSDTLGQTTTAGPDSTTTYTANVTYSNGCTYTDNVIIEVADSFTLPSMTDTVICKGSSVQLDSIKPITSSTTSVMSFTDNTVVIVPDNDPAGVYSYIDVTGVSPAAMNANSIESVCINVNHIFSSDLDIYLIAPNGVIMELSTDNAGGSFNAYTNTCFSPTATTSIVGAPAPLTGTYLPEGSFASLTNSPTNGTWALWVVDDGLGFTGAIVDWSITFADSNIFGYSWTPTAGLSCTNCPDPIVTPTATTTYTVTATDQNGCFAIDSLTIEVIDTLLAPNIFCAGITPFSLTFGWDTVTAAVGYEVNIDNGGWITPTGPGLTHTVTGLAVNQTVNIQVRGISTCPGGSFIGTHDCTTGLCVTGNLVSSTNISCNGGTDGDVTVNASGGTLPYQYSIDGGTPQASGTFMNLAAGNHFVIVVDSFACLDTVFVTLTEPIALATTMTTDSVSCFNGSDGTATVAVIGGTAGYTFAWSNTGTNAMITNLTIGTYVVTVTDANNCQTVDSVVVEEPAELTVTSVATDVSCNGANDGSVTATPVGGNGGYTYSWTGSASSTNIASSLSGGFYTATVNDNKNCTVSITDTVLENTAIVLGETSVMTLCNTSADGMAIVTATGGAGGYTYLWDASAANQVTDTAFNVASSTYSVTVTDSDNCSQIITSTVSSPTALSVSATSTPTSCFNTSDGTGTIVVTGGTAGYSYSWVNSTDTLATGTGLGNGFQVFTVTDANGCTITDSVEVQSPTQINITLTPTAVSCFGVSDGVISATATGGAGGFTFAWSGTTDVTSTVNNLAGGFHTVTVTDVNGCSETDTVTIPEPISLTIALTKTDVSCFNGSDGSASVTVNGGTNPFLYSWTPSGQATPTASNIQAGWHTVVVTDANNCQAVDSILVNQPATGVSTAMSFTPLLCNGDATGTASVLATGGSGTYTYSWSHNTALNNPNATGLQAGTYTVTVSDNNNCDYIDNVTVTEPTALATVMSMTATSCNGYSDGTAMVIPSGGVGSYSYAWLPSGGSDSLATGLLAGLYGVSVTDGNGCILGDTITVDEPDGMTLTMSMTPVSCHSGADGTASVSVVGGTANYTYSWSNSAMTVGTASNLSAGWHVVTVTDANGCFKADSIEVTQPDTLTVTLSAIDVSCFGGSDGSTNVVPLGGVGNYTYAWSPSGQITQSATSLQTGTHIVTVTDDNGCIATGSVFVSQPPTGVTTTTSMTEVLCNGGNTGTATVVATGGAGGYSYLWSNSDTNATATNLISGAYSVTITDQNGCFVVDNVTVDEPSPIQLILGQTATSCFGGDDGTATAIGSGGVPNANGSYLFSWNTSPVQFNTATATGLNGGQTYTVTAQDENGCIVTEDITINQPTQIQLATTQNNVSCHGFTDATSIVTASGGTPGFNYVWTNGDTDALADSLGFGIYTVTVTDFNNCTEEVDVTITEPAPLSITSTVEDVICKGEATGSAILLAAGGTPWYSFTWSDGRTTNEEKNLAAGYYNILMTDANGCKEAHTILVNEPAVALSSSSVPSAVSCYGDRDGEIFVNAVGGLFPYEYSIDGQTFSNSNIIVGLTGGEYVVHVRDDVGCIYTDTVPVGEPAELIVDAGADLYGDFGVGIPILPTVTGGQFPLFYSWTPNDSTLSCITCPVPIAFPNEDQFYTVTVTDVNGCISSDEVAVRIQKERQVYVATGFTPNGDGINDILFIQGGEYSDKVVSFKVYDRWGETVFASGDSPLNDTSFGWNGMFKGDLMNSGVYGWVADIEFSDGERIQFKGNTTLIR
jgi:gliding motility-associated-like protein